MIHAYPHTHAHLLAQVGGYVPATGCSTLRPRQLSGSFHVRPKVPHTLLTDGVATLSEVLQRMCTSREIGPATDVGLFALKPMPPPSTPKLTVSKVLVCNPFDVPTPQRHAIAPRFKKVRVQIYRRVLGCLVVPSVASHALSDSPAIGTHSSTSFCAKRSQLCWHVNPRKRETLRQVQPLLCNCCSGCSNLRSYDAMFLARSLLCCVGC